MVASRFPPDGKIYTGNVTQIYPATDDDCQLWHVVYSDGDEEDLDEDEMVVAHALYVDEVAGEEGDDNSSSEEQYNP